MSRIEYINAKIVTLEQAKLRVNAWKIKRNKIVFTNGCFDIIHKGHVSYLAKAADFGSKLIVALNTDESVRKLEKGLDRPINNECARLQVIASLGFVDLVILFSEETPFETIQILNPDVLVKGADYDPYCTNKLDKKYIVGSDVVLNKGGEVKVIEFEEGYSTSSIVNKLKMG
jgi:rfaE bifunctional protein nucleotidyltransferase chain/domain